LANAFPGFYEMAAKHMKIIAIYINTPVISISFFICRVNYCSKKRHLPLVVHCFFVLVHAVHDIVAKLSYPRGAFG
jgi:hypothetical protein